jgi:hypothetical protein
MRRLICIFVLFLICGCGSQQYTDPYVAMMNNYTNTLAGWNYQSVERPLPPDKPTYLVCTPFTMRGPTYGGYGTSGYTTSRCLEINDERREAYSAALKEYQAVLSKMGAAK